MALHLFNPAPPPAAHRLTAAQLREVQVARVRDASRSQIIADMLAEVPDDAIPELLAGALACREAAAVERIGDHLARLGHLRGRVL